VQLPAMEEETGLRVLAYSGSWWWNDKKYMGTVTPLGIEHEYALIEAEYTDRIVQVGGRDFSEAPEAPRVPQELGKGWTLADLAMWQWTSKLKGIGTESKSQDGDVLMWPWEDFVDFISLKPPELTDHEKITILWEKHPELHPPTEG